MMHMTFYWGKEVTLLVDSWKTATWLSYSLSLLVCFTMALFYQYLENRRIRVKRICSSGSPSDPAIEPLLLNKLTGKRWMRVAASVIFAISAGIGYLLMLAIMSFNGGVFVAVVAGLGVGYLIFRSGEDESVDQGNSCACA